LSKQIVIKFSVSNTIGVYLSVISIDSITCRRSELFWSIYVLHFY